MKVLREAQVSRYKEDGFVFPVSIFDSHLAQDFVSRIDQSLPPSVNVQVGQKVHLLQTWAADLAKHPRLLDVVEDVLGSNILCWGMRTFFKEPMSEEYVSWHQDSFYWGFREPSEVVTAWIALSPITCENGCLRMERGSHFVGVLPHVDTKAPGNMLTRGQEVISAIEPDRVAHVVLNPGEISLHNVHTIHSSDPNRSTQRRLGVAIRYVTPSARRMGREIDSTWLLRGQDSSGYFYHEKPPTCDFDSSAIAEHAKSLRIRLGAEELKRAAGAASEV